MRKKILLFGATGMVGQEIVRCFSDEAYSLVCPPHQTVDITDRNGVFETIHAHQPDIINAAVSVNVDWCERNRKDAFLANSMGPAHIAEAMLALSSKPLVAVHYSSSDVFGSEFDETPVEDAAPAPINIYGYSKYCGENLFSGILRATSHHWYIIRSSWLYSEFKKTFVDGIAEHVLRPGGVMKLAVDQRGAPTWGRELVRKTRVLLEGGFPSGRYHFASEVDGLEATRFEIAEAIAGHFRIGEFKKIFAPGKRKEIFAAPRPASSAIRNSKFAPLSFWRDSLNEYLQKKYG